MPAIIYNPKKGSAITNFRWLGSKWELPVNSMAKFPSEVASELKRRFGFLQEVSPDMIEEVKERMKSYEFNCDQPDCDYGADTAKQLNMHMLGKHKLSKEKQDALDSIPEAKNEQVGKVLVERKLSIEEQEGISKGNTNGWYGNGLEADLPASFGSNRAGKTIQFTGA